MTPFWHHYPVSSLIVAHFLYTEISWLVSCFLPGPVLNLTFIGDLDFNWAMFSLLPDILFDLDMLFFSFREAASVNREAASVNKP